MRNISKRVAPTPAKIPLLKNIFLRYTYSIICFSSAKTGDGELYWVVPGEITLIASRHILRNGGKAGQHRKFFMGQRTQGQRNQGP